MWNIKSNATIVYRIEPGGRPFPTVGHFNIETLLKWIVVLLQVTEVSSETCHLIYASRRNLCSFLFMVSHVFHHNKH